MPWLVTFLFALFASLDAAGDTCIRQADELMRATNLLADEDTPFELTARVSYVRFDVRSGEPRAIVVNDASGASVVFALQSLPSGKDVRPGDQVRISGLLQPDGWPNVSSRWPFATNCVTLARGTPPTPADIPIADLQDGKADFRLVRTTGVLRDVAQSETAPNWIVLVLCQGKDQMFVSVPGTNGDLPLLERLVGRRVSAIGVYLPKDRSPRKRKNGSLKVASPAAVTPLDNGEEGSDEMPDIAALDGGRHVEMQSLGRHAATGRILAVWQPRRGLLRTDDGTLVNLDFAGEQMPRCGDRIQAVGLPESDVFDICLCHVSWQRLSAEPPPDEAAERISTTAIFPRGKGSRIVRNNRHGKLVSIDGIVRSIPVRDGNHRFFLESDGELVPVDATACPECLTTLKVGSRVTVRGVCVMEREERRTSTSLSRLKGFLLVIRSADDLTVLSSPSWWTPARLVGAILALLVGLVAILLWNVALRKVALRKSRELVREQLRHLNAALKTEERTRLAVELHDSLAQNLTGVSLEIDTAAKVADGDPAAMKTHLGIAARSLKSCRDELRNCLWDLRNRALEEQTMDEAIRQTLAPHVAGVDVAIRFAVPRERISDNTAHAILRIVRELTLNGIRHGGATKIRIAGSIEGDRMLFSVRDNGRGFDPERAPGFSEGHYGLLGIRERVDEFEGEFTLESSQEKGTRATVSLKVPQES